MSKQDYIKLAYGIKTCLYDNVDKARLIKHLIIWLGQDNPRFDKEIFYNACWSNPYPKGVYRSEVLNK